MTPGTRFFNLVSGSPGQGIRRAPLPSRSTGKPAEPAPAPPLLAAPRRGEEPLSLSLGPHPAAAAISASPPGSTRRSLASRRAAGRPSPTCCSSGRRWRILPRRRGGVAERPLTAPRPPARRSLRCPQPRPRNLGAGLPSSLPPARQDRRDGLRCGLGRNFRFPPPAGGSDFREAA